MPLTDLRNIYKRKRINLYFLHPPRGYTKKRVLFIVNPISGEKIARWINSHVLKILRSRYLTMDIVKTEYAGHAPEIVKANLNNYDIFVAVGGDGTANEVAGMLIGTDKIFSILPSGSGNGCARELGFPPIGLGLVRLMVKGDTKKMDVLYLNDHHSINVSGIGYDATIAKRFQKRESRGMFNYLLIILRSFFCYHPLDYHFYMDGQEISTKAFLISFANTRQFGNNAYIAPDAKYDDGLIDLVIIKPFPRKHSLKLGFYMMTKKMKSSPYVTTYQCKEIVFDEPYTRWYHIDGDPIKLRGPVKVTIAPEALRVFDTKRSIFH